MVNEESADSPEDEQEGAAADESRANGTRTLREKRRSVHEHAVLQN